MNILNFWSKNVIAEVINIFKKVLVYPQLFFILIE